MEYEYKPRILVEEWRMQQLLRLEQEVEAYRTGEAWQQLAKFAAQIQRYAWKLEDEIYELKKNLKRE